MRHCGHAGGAGAEDQGTVSGHGMRRCAAVYRCAADVHRRGAPPGGTGKTDAGGSAKPAHCLLFPRCGHGFPPVRAVFRRGIPAGKPRGYSGSGAAERGGVYSGRAHVPPRLPGGEGNDGGKGDPPAGYRSQRAHRGHPSAGAFSGRNPAVGIPDRPFFRRAVKHFVVAKM